MDEKELLDGLKDLGFTNVELDQFKSLNCCEKYKLLNDKRAEFLECIKYANKKIEIVDYLLCLVKDQCNK